MNIKEFSEIFAGVGLKTKVSILCDGCGGERHIQKENVRRVIEKHGSYICRSCSMKKHHETHDYTDERKAKISDSLTGITRSKKTKAKMSESKTAFYQTEEGKKVRRVLSRHTARQHARTNMDKSKRKVLYISAKNNGEVRVCNSSGEYIACEDILEKNANIVRYDTQVYYEINDRSRSLDFLIEFKDGTKKVVEVKPAKRTTEKDNLLQFNDSAAYAEKMGWGFEVWTELTLQITNWKEATRRADEYRKTHYLIDYTAYRAEMDRKKAKRHYDGKIATDRVIVFCEYCEEYHEPLRQTYEKAIKTKGRFICEREGGHIGGSKPKKRKVNPFEVLGKKQCTGPCGRVLPFDSFSPDKSRLDGYASRCKECRAEFYKGKYRGSK